MHFRFLGADHGPAAFGLHAAMGRLSIRPHMAETIAMGHLIEPIPRSLRTDLDWLEQDIVTGIARHDVTGLLLVALRASQPRMPSSCKPRTSAPDKLAELPRSDSEE